MHHDQRPPVHSSNRVDHRLGKNSSSRSHRREHGMSSPIRRPPSDHELREEQIQHQYHHSKANFVTSNMPGQDHTSRKRKRDVVG